MKFESMPLSAKTRYSLKVAKLEIATEIQAAAIPHALAGRCVDDDVRFVCFRSTNTCQSILRLALRCDHIIVPTNSVNRTYIIVASFRGWF